MVRPSQHNTSLLVFRNDWDLPEDNCRPRMMSYSNYSDRWWERPGCKSTGRWLVSRICGLVTRIPAPACRFVYAISLRDTLTFSSLSYFTDLTDFLTSQVITVANETTNNYAGSNVKTLKFNCELSRNSPNLDVGWGNDKLSGVEWVLPQKRVILLWRLLRSMAPLVGFVIGEVIG